MPAAFALYLITEATAPGDVLETVRAALSQAPPGRVCVQLRAKQASAREQYTLARELLPVCRARQAPLVINDRIDVALAVGADGVHLPEQGLPLSAARVLLGPRALIGVSCHASAGLAAAAAGGADFTTLSPVFESPGKGEPLGAERFLALTHAAQLPVYALGGIQARHAAQLRAAGAQGLAVISAVSRAPDPGGALHALLQAWDAAL
ncbi:MAG: thiamine phosphate synthase [Polyangiales bacterium]